jgi:hypothetical protein
MVLQDLDDLAGTASEVARVLKPGGAFCFSIVHPFASAHDPTSFRRDRPLVTSPYLAERRYSDHVERNGLSMTFVSVHRPLSTYVQALATAGLLIEDLREFAEGPIPWLLVSSARKIR